MHQIAEWPEKLGMSEYAQRFAENRIDISVLSRSTGATSFIPQRLSDLARAHADWAGLMTPGKPKSIALLAKSH